MITIPYDTGVFDSQIGEYVKVVHEAGGLVALDQANFNGVMTRLRAGDVGADMMQFNLHKTFSTPHGSYGPATGAVGVKAHLRAIPARTRSRRTTARVITSTTTCRTASARSAASTAWS